MLLKLCPNAPDPTVLFELTFDDLPEGVIPPPAWVDGLASLQMDDLELPERIHSLDKSSWLPTILDSVIFDLACMTVRCTFIDGYVDEWPLDNQSCRKAIEQVIHDVNRSMLPSERRLDKERGSRQSENHAATSLNSLSKPFKHKKHRSLLMAVVSVVVHLGSSSISTFTGKSSRLVSPQRPQSCPPTPERRATDDLPQTCSSRNPSPRALRRRARSSIIDIFRLHVQSELTCRLPLGGYDVWIAKSMFRRACLRMDEILKDAGIKSLQVADTSNVASDHASSLPCSPGLTPDDETDVDVDGFSIRTPSSQTAPNSFYFVPSSESGSDGSTDSLSHSFETPLSPDSASPEAFAEYRNLSAMCTRLRQLVMSALARESHAEQEKRQMESMLEVRSRRKAWLNKALASKLCSAMDVGLSTPFHRSPLSVRSWSADDYEYESKRFSLAWTDFPLSDVAGPFSRFRSRKSDSPLFPVSEEEGEEIEEEMLEHASGYPISDPGRAAAFPCEDDEDQELGGNTQLMSNMSLTTPPSPPRSRTDSLPSKTNAAMQLHGTAPLAFPLQAPSPCSYRRNRYDRCFLAEDLPQSHYYPSSDDPYGSSRAEISLSVSHASSLSQAEEGIFVASLP